MANASFGGVELSTLGLSVRGINGRNIAAWRPERVEILGRQQLADLNGRYDLETRTVLAGNLSAPDSPWSSFTHAQWLTKLDSLKAALDPELGYKKLIITGDRATFFRWARLAEHDLAEVYPVFKRPFQECNLAFDNLEPFWRVTQTQINNGTIPVAIANDTKKTRPIIIAKCGATAPPNPVDLFTIDGLVVSWAWDSLTNPQSKWVKIDSDTLTAQVSSDSGATWKDAIRSYRSSSTRNDGFPIIAAAGSSISAKWAGVTTFQIDYDKLYL